MVLISCIFKPAVVQQLVQKVGFCGGKKKTLFEGKLE